MNMFGHMLITAKFESSCKICHRLIRAGDRIAWTRGVREVSHAVCSEEGKQIVETVAKSRAVDTEISLPVPTGKEYLGYQRAGIAYALAHQSTLIADEMGLGKTIQAIGIINASPKIHTVCVVCPASLKLNWRNELRTWSTRPTTIRIIPQDQGIDEGNDVQVTIINYDILKKLPANASYDLLILDEAHYAKNPKSARTKLVQALAKRCTHVVALTGTPILNKPIELWPILQMVAPETWDPAGYLKGKNVNAGEGAGFFKFAKRYCAAHEEFHGRTSHWEFGGHSNLEELQEKLRSTCMVRRMKANVLKELPPKRRQSVVIGNGCSDDFGDLGDDFDTMTRRTKEIPFEELSRVRHEQATRKIEPAIEHIRGAVEASDKVVVFAHHTDVIDGLVAGLSDLGVVVLVGDTSQKDRQLAVERFQTDDSIHVFMGSLKAAGVGLTLTASSHVVFVEIDWVPATLTQAEDRCHRIGQTESVLVQHLVLAGSLDERMSRFVIEKQNVTDLALDVDTFGDVSNRPIAETTEQLRARIRARRLLEAGLTELDIGAIHAKLQWLASQCDGAQVKDGHGFNKLDTNFGKALASQEQLTVGQALAAKKLLVKYTRQLSHYVQV